jgi:pimeloyl-ACP methyl ester carboxylesterase
MRPIRKSGLIIVIVIVIAAIIVIYVGLSIGGAWKAMEIPRLPVQGSPASAGLDYRDVSFQSRDDNITLRGWYIPGGGNAVIIIVHGGFQNRIDENVDTLGLTRELAGKGYSVLLFDLRGRGESDGRGLALSYIERDIGGAVDFIKGEGYASEKIYILGFCSGAAASCIFSSQNSPGALILDGCFVDVPTMVRREAASYGIPEFLTAPFLPGVLLATRIFYDYNMVNPIDVVADITCPIFFIHEERDNYITLEETRLLLAASGNPANELWEIGGTEHSQSYRINSREYIERVDSFLTAKAREKLME